MISWSKIPLYFPNLSVQHLQGKPWSGDLPSQCEDGGHSPSPRHRHVPPLHPSIAGEDRKAPGGNKESHRSRGPWGGRATHSQRGSGGRQKSAHDLWRPSTRAAQHSSGGPGSLLQSTESQSETTFKVSLQTDSLCISLYIHSVFFLSPRHSLSSPKEIQSTGSTLNQLATFWALLVRWEEEPLKFSYIHILFEQLWTFFRYEAKPIRVRIFLLNHVLNYLASSSWLQSCQTVYSWRWATLRHGVKP